MNYSNDINGGGSFQGPQQPMVHGPEYTMPKILDYLQSEWFKYEVDRSHWISEKSDLMSRITKLESERKTQETIKNDLFRRVRMLEYALHQERLKNNQSYRELHKDNKEQHQQTIEKSDELSQNAISQKNQLTNNLTRDRIRKYLKSMDINDFIVSKPPQSIGNHVEYNNNAAPRQHTGSNDQDEETHTAILDVSGLKKLQQLKQQQQSAGESTKQKLLKEVESLNGSHINGDAGIPESLSDLASSLDSLSSDIGTSSIESLDQLDSLMGNAGDTSDSLSSLLLKKQESSSSSSATDNQNNFNNNSSIIDNNSVIHSNNNSSSINEPSYDSLNEDFFNKLSSNSKGRMKLKGLNNLKFSMDNEPDSGTPTTSSTVKKKGGTITPVGSLSKRTGKSISQFGAQDLSDLKLDDNSVGSGGMMRGGSGIFSSSTGMSESSRNWRFRHSLKSHLDGVRSIAFDNDNLLVSASEDHTVKVWNIQQLAPTTKKSSSAEIEPICTMRGHTGPVFTCTLAESDQGKFIYSGGSDCVVRQWAMPSPDTDPYQGYGIVSPYLRHELVGHTDAVWQVINHPSKNISRIISASADGTIRIWDNGNEVRRFTTETRDVVPTSLSISELTPNHLFIGYSDGALSEIDIEAGNVVRQYKIGGNNSSSSEDEQINKVIAHPFLPMVITGGEDKKIEFWDTTSGDIIHSMIAHSDAITSLAIDPSGLYLASSSHDPSVRFWDISSKTCLQDLNSHRPKYDESTHSIAYHPTKGYFASSGADSVIRIHQ